MFNKNLRQGKFTPTNPSKYAGDPNNIVYRSSWELRAMTAFDTNDNIKKWASEELIIPYFWEVDNKWHRYYPDFVLVTKNDRKILIEVKPYAQTQEPVKKKGKRKKTLLNESITYSKNLAKWNAAKEYCRTHSMTFRIMTEYDLFPNGKAY